MARYGPSRSSPKESVSPQDPVCLATHRAQLTTPPLARRLTKTVVVPFPSMKTITL
jgi:hypothetical protein